MDGAWVGTPGCAGMGSDTDYDPSSILLRTKIALVMMAPPPKKFLLFATS